MWWLLLLFLVLGLSLLRHFCYRCQRKKAVPILNGRVDVSGRAIPPRGPSPS